MQVKRYNESHMISKYQLKNILWINLEKPKNEEITVLLEEHPYLIPIKDQILKENFNKEIYLKDIDIKMFSVSNIVFIMGEKILITINNNTRTKAFSDFTKEVELNTIENRNISDVNYLILKLLKYVIKEDDCEIKEKDTLIKNLQRNNINKTQKIKKLYFYKYSLFIILLISIILYVIKIL